MAALFETHAHYDSSHFDKDGPQLLDSLPLLADYPVTKIINAGVDSLSSQKGVELSRRHSHVFAAVGCHPTNLLEHDDAQMSKIEALCEDSGVVAVGETGLDYYHDNVLRNVQKHWFIEHISLAGKTGLPLVVHSREACADTLSILRQYAFGRVKGVLHCFPGSLEIAEEYVRNGFYLGIGGVVTYSNARKLKDVVSTIPLKHLVIETDCPYLTPRPLKPSARNDSSNLRYIVEEIADLKHISIDEAAEATYNNAERLFFS